MSHFYMLTGGIKYNKNYVEFYTIYRIYINIYSKITETINSSETKHVKYCLALLTTQ